MTAKMKRRQFITLLGSAAAWPLAARAQQAGKVARLGWLRLGSAADFAGRVEALRTGLRELGYVEGKDIVIEFRWPETVDQLSEFAAELVGMNVDIIFASSSIEVGAVRQVTKTIPLGQKIEAVDKDGDVPVRCSLVGRCRLRFIGALITDRMAAGTS